LNKIDAPAYADGAAFHALANNKKVSSFPALKNIVPKVQAAYKRYRKTGGNALKVAPVQLTSKQRNFLQAHYKKPPGDLKYISELRESTEHLACPMCGSMHRGTLDHLLPKNTYAEFAVFSLNLVPACKCNSKRKVLTGRKAGERILHPYFDACLGERLISAKFEDLGAVPKVSTQIVVPSTHPEYAAVSFHVRSIVRRTAIDRYFADRWSRMYRKPMVVVRGFGNRISSFSNLRTIIETELALRDEECGGKNNWNSAFVAGLLDTKVCEWLFSRLSVRGRTVNQPLGPL
jgi:hypothetical protein